MIIRKLTKDDVREHDKVSSQAYTYSCNIDDEASVLPCENMLGAFADDSKTLFADMEINDRICFFGKNTLACAAVGGVAAKPEHRGKGAVKAIFNELFKDEKYDISILYPFSGSYYRNYGYENIGTSVKAFIPFSEFCDVKRNSDAVLFEGENPEEVLSVYNKCAEKYRLCFKRTKSSAFPEKPYLSQRFTYIYKSNALATFYISRSESILCVKEIYFDSPESLKGIIGFLRNFSSNQKFICFEKIPFDSPVFSLVKDIKNCKITFNNNGGVRILNAENILKYHDYENKTGCFTVKINDTVLRNNKTFTVDYTDGEVSVNEAEKNKTPDIEFDILAASKVLLCGTESCEALLYNPGVKIYNRNSDFFSVFKQSTVFFTDEF